MFKVGDTVRNVAANIVGVVVETDGDTIYLEQPNGAEVDFPASALVLEDAFQAQHGGSSAEAEPSENDKVYDAVIGNLYPAIVEMGRRSHANAERLPGVAVKSWEDLSSLQKLNAVSAATDVPVSAWLEANRPGTKTPMGPFQLSILAKMRQKS